jgi:putative tricarboxylic transport membrane protein
MRRFDFPAAPTIIGMILGPFAEQEFRRAMTISGGDMSVFLTRPLSASLLCIAAALLLLPPLLRLFRK